MVTKRNIGLCKDCVFWRSLQTMPTYGECRLNGPTVQPPQTKALWPITPDTGYCGEFADRSEYRPLAADAD